MNNTYVYKIADSLYINLTNKCSNDCTFCIRSGGDLSGYNLWLQKEPEANEVIDLIKEYPKIRSIVFCGYGEPTYRLPQLLEIAKYAKTNGYKVRLDTNGLGSLINGRDITADLKGYVDVLSVSLNAADKTLYDKVARPSLPDSYPHMLEFVQNAVKRGIKVILTAVDVIGEEAAQQCSKLCKELGAEFRLREYIQPQQQKDYYSK